MISIWSLCWSLKPPKKAMPNDNRVNFTPICKKIMSCNETIIIWIWICKKKLRQRTCHWPGLLIFWPLRLTVQVKMLRLLQGSPGGFDCHHHAVSLNRSFRVCEGSSRSYINNSSRSRHGVKLSHMLLHLCISLHTPSRLFGPVVGKLYIFRAWQSVQDSLKDFKSDWNDQGQSGFVQCFNVNVH